MSSIKTTQIDGDVSVGRNVAIGGNAEIAGSAHFGHNLKVDGWLEASNIKGANKGVFLTVQALREAYPNPHDGWFAGVGSSTPFAAYTGVGGEWVATGGSIDLTVDMHDYTEEVSQLREEVADLKSEVEEYEAAVEGADISYETLGEDNVQLKNGGGDLLMPRTNECNVYKVTSDYVTGKSGTGTGSSYLTLNIGTLQTGTDYRLEIDADSAVAADCAIKGMVGTTVKVSIGTLTSGSTTGSFTFNTGENAVNKIQVRGNQARTFTVRIYRDTAVPLPDHLAAIENDISALDSELHGNLNAGFKAYSSSVTKSVQTGTTYPWSILPHKVAPCLFCKLEFTDVTSGGSVTVKALAGSTAVKTIGTVGSGDTSKTFLFQCASEFDKIQLVAGNSTISYTARLYVMSGFYRNAEEHRDFLTKSSLFRSGLRCIAHQGFSDDQYPSACRRSAIIAAANNHFNGVEVDLVFSSDDVPFLCHDTTFKDGNTGNTITIANETAEDLVNYAYYGESICTLDEAVRLCKLYGLDMILDHTASVTTPARADAVVEIVSRYKAWRNIIWTTSSSVLTQSAILALYPQARVHTVSDGAVTQSKIEAVNAVAAQGVNIILSFNYENNPLETVVPLLRQLDPRVEVSVYDLELTSNPTSDTARLFRQYMPYVDYALSGMMNKFRIDTGYVNIYDNSEQLSL